MDVDKKDKTKKTKKVKAPKVNDDEDEMDEALDDGKMGEGAMITALCWVGRGYAKPVLDEDH